MRPYNHYNSLSYKELTSNIATIQANKNRYFMINGYNGAFLGEWPFILDIDLLKL